MNCACGRDLGVGHDGQHRQCKCGRYWDFVNDELLGCYWVPRIKSMHVQESTKVKLRKQRVEAQSVGGIFPQRKVR